MSTPRRWTLFLLAAGSVLAPSCAFTCTLIGGQDGLIVEVEVTGGTLPAGDYAIIARVDGVELRIDETLDATGGGVTASGTPEAVVDGKRLFLDGAVFGQSGSLMVGFREGRGPAEVTIEVWRGDTMLGQETYTPRYTEYRPNGAHCPPELQQARDTIVLAAPAS
jgi:hypothetical protein